MGKTLVKVVAGESQADLPVFGDLAKRFEAIERRAFDLFEKRGCRGGFDQEDWLQAEHELLGSAPAELSEKDGIYKAEIALPGFESKDIEVTATPSELVVHAAASQEKKTEKENVLWTEFASNDVYRRFELPHQICADKVTATLENGLLRITAPEVVGKLQTASA